MRAAIFIIEGKEAEEEIGNVPEIDLKSLSLRAKKEGFQARSRGIANLWNDGKGKTYTIDLKLVQVK